jgi:hypothetical protein
VAEESENWDVCTLTEAGEEPTGVERGHQMPKNPDELITGVAWRMVMREWQFPVKEFPFEIPHTKFSVSRLLFAFSSDGDDPTAICFSRICSGSMGRYCKRQDNDTENQVLPLM